MFCNNCGKEISEGSLFCEGCGTPVAQPSVAEKPAPEVMEAAAPEVVEAAAPEVVETVAEAAEAAPVVVEPEAVAEPVVAEESVVQVVQPPVKKSHKKLWIVLGIVAAVIAALVACFFLFKDAIMGLFVSFMPAEKQLQYTYSQAVKNFTADFTDVYTETLDATGKDQAATGSMVVELDGTLLSAAGLPELNKVQLDYRIDSKPNNGLMGMSWTAKVKDTELLTMNMTVNTNDGTVTMELPGLIDGAVSMNLYEQSGMDSASAALSKMDTEKIKQLLPSADLLNTLLPKLTEVAFTSIKDVDSKKDTLSVNDVEQKATLLKVDITEEVLADMAIAVMRELKTNKDVKNYLQDSVDILADMEDELNLSIPDADEIYDEFTDMLDEGIKSLRDVDGDEELATFSTWVNSKFEILAIGFEVPDADVELFIGKAQDGNNVGYQVSAHQQKNELLMILGEGTETKGKLDATFTVEFSGRELGTFACSGFDTEALDKDGYLNGTFTFTLSKDIGRYLELPSVISSLSVKITCEQGADFGKITIELSDLVKVSFDSKTSGNATVKVPSDATEDIQEWASGINAEEVMERLEAIGIDQEMLFDMIYGGYGYGNSYGDSYEDVYADSYYY